MAAPTYYNSLGDAAKALTAQQQDPNDPNYNPAAGTAGTTPTTTPSSGTTATNSFTSTGSPSTYIPNTSSTGSNGLPTYSQGKWSYPTTMNGVPTSATFSNISTTDPHYAPGYLPYAGSATNESGGAWSGIDPRLVQLYQQYGVSTPGARGSGFKDAAYWNDLINSAGWDYVQGRLSADLAGTGSDTPGSGDAGNTSGYGAGSSSGGASGAMSDAGYTAATGQYDSGPMWDLIQQQLQQNAQPVSANDPNIMAATGAMKVGLDAANRDARASLAQRSAAEGTNLGGQGSGAFDTALQAQSEQEGTQLGSFAANQVLTEIQNRRNQVIQLLGAARGEQALALQQTLANLNNQLQYYQLHQQNNQFYDNLGLNAAEAQYGYNQNYANTLNS